MQGYNQGNGPSKPPRPPQLPTSQVPAVNPSSLDFAIHSPYSSTPSPSASPYTYQSPYSTPQPGPYSSPYAHQTNAYQHHSPYQPYHQYPQTNPVHHQYPQTRHQYPHSNSSQHQYPQSDPSQHQYPHSNPSQHQYPHSNSSQHQYPQSSPSQHQYHQGNPTQQQYPHSNPSQHQYPHSNSSQQQKSHFLHQPFQDNYQQQKQARHQQQKRTQTQPTGQKPTGGWKQTVNKSKKQIDFDIPETIKEQVKRIANANTTEEVNAYIQARKRSFPTRSNQKKAQKEEVEKQERGQVVAEPQTRIGENSGKKRKQSSPSADAQENICQWYNRGNCKYGKKCAKKHDPKARETFQKQEWSKPRKLGSLILPKPADSLLRKLFEKELTDEYNIIFQCFRHFVKTNFLQQAKDWTTMQEFPPVSSDSDQESVEEGQLLE